MKKSRFKRAMGEILAVFEKIQPGERREFFGMATKLMLEERYWDDSAPATGFETLSEELTHFQTGFTDLNAGLINDPSGPSTSVILPELHKIQNLIGAKGKGSRRRVLRKRLNNLRKLARKTLMLTKTPRPRRGKRVFFRSLTNRYVDKKRGQGDSILRGTTNPGSSEK